VHLLRLSRHVASLALGTALFSGLTLAARGQSSTPSSPPPANGSSSSSSSGSGWSPDFSLAFRAGTPGLGAQADVLLWSHLGVRAGFNDVRFSLNHSIQDVAFDGKLGLETIPILADIYPWARGSFHLTGGVVVNKNQFSATGQPTSNGTYTFNGNTYDSAQVGTLAAKVTYPTSAYVGLGWGSPAQKSRVAFIFDLGAIIGTPTFTLTSTNPTNNAQLASDIQEQQAKSQHDVQKYAKVYPVIDLGLAVRL
jgi:hypothetical protein